tara:strand:+ start:299 stop:457 length:159 start_codon:yes stop_codon:yes gene_type:complete
MFDEIATRPRGGKTHRKVAKKEKFSPGKEKMEGQFLGTWGSDLPSRKEEVLE